MSGSDLQSALQFIQLNDCTSVAIIAAVGYDYILNFSREIDYIWCRKWSMVSTTYILIRYIGLYWAIINGIAATTFVPGPVIVSTVIFLTANWTYPVFLAAADLMMILRVYAMWNQSKTILGIFLAIYIPQTVLAFVFAGVYYNPKTYFSVSVAQIFNYTYCNYTNSTPILTAVLFSIPRFALSIALFVLALAQTVIQSVEMYKVTKQWRTNWILQLFARDGILYFLINLAFNISLAVQYAPGNNPIAITFVDALTLSVFCQIVPRFILEVRELHDHDIRNRGIDTGFGISQPAVGEEGTVAFMDVAGSLEQSVALEDVATTGGEPDAILAELREV